MNAYDLINRVIERGYKNPDVIRTVELSKFYRQIVTMELQNELVISYKPLENEKQKENRCEIHKSKTPAVVNQIGTQFDHVKGASRVKDTIEYAGEIDRKADKAVLESRVSRFYGRQTLQQFVEEKEKHYAFIDPNAWLVIVPYENENGEIVPNPVIFESATVVDFSVVGGITEYLITKEIEGSTVKINYFAKGIRIIAMQGAKIEGAEGVKRGDYIFYEYPNDTSETAAIRFGYIPDDYADGRTFVGLLQPVGEEFKDLINAQAEYLLSIAFHTWLRKYQLVDVCTGFDPAEQHYRCRNGILTNNVGETKGACTECKGTGRITHVSSQDVIYVKKPTDNEEKAVPLSEIEHYSTMPFDIVEHQQERVDRIAKGIPKYIFGVDLETRSSGLKTATEINSFTDAIDAVIRPYAEKISEIVIFSTVATAEILGIEENLIVSHRYPLSFKMETMGELLVMLKDAKASGASPEIIWGIELRIAEMQNKDNPYQLELMRLKRKYKPFKELTESERMVEVSNLEPSNRYRILHGYLDLIFDRALAANPKFTTLTQAAQDEIIYKIVDELKAELAQPIISLELPAE